MQVSLENTSNLERRMTVSLPAERLSGAIDTRLRNVAPTVNLKGFRRGKVPAKVIKQRYGAQIRNEAYGDLVRSSFDEAVREHNLTLAGSPSIKSEDGGEAGEIRYTATFEVVPDYGQIDVSTLQVDRETAKVEESDVDNMIETLRRQKHKWVPVERAAREGDLVTVETHAEVAGKRIPAEGVEPGKTVIGSGGLFPGVEAHLAGMSIGETRTVEVGFPMDWRVADMAGKMVAVTIKLLTVSEGSLPEVDAAFAKSFGIKGGKLDVFRKEVRANLERELRGNLMLRLRAEVTRKLVAAYSHVELPPRLVEAEARGLLRNAQQQARERGQPVDGLGHEQFMTVARNRIAAALLVGEIARQNDLQLDPALLRETMQLIASTYEDPQQVIDLYRNDPQMMANLRNRVMEEQVIDWIAERAKHSEVVLGFAEAMRPPA
jgi:trigger factor